MDHIDSHEERIRKLENRVAYLERQLAMSVDKKEAIEVPSAISPVDQEQQQPTKEIEWDVLLFQKIIPRSFIVVLLIGILWGFKAASDLGMITNNVKVLLGFIAGLALIAIGIWQYKQKRYVLGQVLLGGAIPTLMITTFAMHQLYHIVGPTPAFILNVVWILAGIGLTFYYRSQGIGIVASIGGILVPFLIESTSPNIPVFVLYETILYTLFLILALRFRFKFLYSSSAILLHIALAIFFLFATVPDEMRWIAMIPIFVQQIAMIAGFLLRQVLLNAQAYNLFSSLLLASLWIQSVFKDWEAALLFGLLAVIYGALYYISKLDSVRAPILIANNLISLLLFIYNLEPNISFEAMIIITFMYLLISHKYNSSLHTILCSLSFLISLMLLFSYQVDAWMSWELLHWVSFITITIYGIIYMIRNIQKERKLILNIGIPFIAIILLSFTSMIASLIAINADVDLERIIMGVIWIILAILFIVLGQMWNLVQGRYVGVAILFFTLGKIILVDIYFISIGVRAILFILLGAAGLLVSRMLYSKKE